MYSLARDDSHPYLHRQDDPHRLYQHAVPRAHQHHYTASSPVDDFQSPYAQRRFAPGTPATRFPDHHIDYQSPQGLPPLSSSRLGEISRIDTSAPFSRRDESQLPSAQPLSATSVELSNDSEPWSPTQSRPRKPRREKPRIELAPDQPPTTQGKPRARVYVACLQCRTRKIRCDGAKPTCHNCGKRSGSNDCNYDPLPKRRGPDKNPGARQRIARKNGETSARPRRRNTSSADASTFSAQNSGNQLPPFSFPSPSSSENTNHSRDDYIVSPHEARLDASFSRSTCPCHGLPRCPSSPSSAGLEHSLSGSQISVPYDGTLNFMLASPLESPPIPQAYITEYNDDDENDQRYASQDTSAAVSTIARQPSMEFPRKIWWDSLLSLYLSPASTRLDNISASQRNLATQQINADLRFLIRTSNYWFSFLHAPTFFHNVLNPSKRQRIQPSLILAALAMSTFWQSSEIGLGHDGRMRALRFRDEAQGALEASYNDGWVDDSLAQAAWILAMFEVCAHPYHSRDRSASAMVMLDSIIRYLSLTRVDMNDPNTSRFSPGKVPEVAPAPQPSVPPFQSYQDYRYDTPTTALPVSTDRGCSCLSLTLREQWSQTMEYAPLWAQTPAWSAEWSEAEIQKESRRRLCWSAGILAAGHSNYSYATRLHGVDLFIADPSNYALLFSGEVVVQSPSAKDTIWALHDRAYLLWHACVKMRNDLTASVTTKGQFAVKAWLEADAIEQALDRHTCGIERAFIFQGREYIFNTRMCITYEFQRFVPLPTSSGMFQREKVEHWLRRQAGVAQNLTNALHTLTGGNNNLARRPFFVFWLMAQVSRGLALWHGDKSMTLALDVCKKILAPIDCLTALWPCAEQRHRYEALRERLRNACEIAQVSPPPPLNMNLPAPPPIQEFV